MGRLYRTPAAERQVRTWCKSRLDGWSVPHRTLVVPTRVGDIHLTEVGAGPVTCLYLPGTSFCTATSMPVLGVLAERHRVVAADLPGQPGLSTSRRPATRAAGDAGWLADVVAALREPSADTPILVVGHSRGAVVALQAEPEEVDGLVLLSPAGLVPVRVTARLLGATLPWLARPTAARSARLLELMSGPGSAADADLVDWMTLVARGTRATGAPGPLPEVLVHRWQGRPVRVVSGAHDCFFPLDRLTGPVRRLLEVDLEVVPGAGHLVTEERPDAVAAAVAATAADVATRRC